MGQRCPLTCLAEVIGLIDSHCHFDFAAFDGQREDLLRDCAAAGVKGLIVPATQSSRWNDISKLSDLNTAKSQLWLAFGVHPWWFASTNFNEIEFKTKLADYLHRDGAVAIGECGLDGNLDAPIEQQQPIFEWQLQLACELNLPLIIHAHRAHNQVMSLLSRYRPSAGGVIHGFSGSFELAQQYWRLGFYLGVGGTITYERAKKTRQAIERMPLESLLLETDAPDMPLQGYQGQTNSPLQLPLIAAALASLKSLPECDIASQSVSNTQRLFSLY